MAITLPLPFRVAAGILGAGIDRVRALPEDIPALPVSLVGNAMRLSMKVQQEIAALATRGDELLGGVIGAPQEHPSWARFDDDDEPAAPPARPRPASTGRTTASGPDRRTDRDSRGATADTADDRAAGIRADSSGADSSGADSNGGGHHLTTPETSSLPPETTIAMAAAVEVPEAVVEQALIAADDADQLLDEQQADAVIDEIVEAVATGADAEALADISDDVAQAAVDEAAAELEEVLVEEAVLEEALIEETVLEEVALQEAAVEAAVEAAEQAAVVDAIEEALEEVAEEAALEEAAEDALEEALEDAAEQAALEETLVEVAAEEQVLEDALVEAAVEEAVLTDQLDRVVAENAEAEAVLRAEIEETEAAEAVLADALEETLDEEAEIEAALNGDAAAADEDFGGGDSGDDAQLPLPGYERLTLAQVRGHLRDLSADDVSVLLQFERDTENRPPFLTLLSNRLVTLDAQNS